jgi:hypothetical protein
MNRGKMSFIYAIPSDIFNNHIIPYIYSPQQKPLLEDIKSYNKTKELLNEYTGHPINNYIIQFVLEYTNDNIYDNLMDIIWKRYNILNPYYNDINLHKFIVFHKFTFDFKPIWGLLTHDERINFISFVSMKNDNMTQIMNTTNEPLFDFIIDI